MLRLNPISYLLAAVILAPALLGFSSSGGLEAPSAICNTPILAKEHRAWAKKYKNKTSISQKAHKKHQSLLRCAKNTNHAKVMHRFWKRVKKSILPKNHDLWIRIGRCEQPGSGYKGVFWSHRGPTYQGGLGFWYGTWDSFKYREMPDNAGEATWREQMQVANRLLQRYGTSPWGCA